jgi:hypothetical protein
MPLAPDSADQPGAAGEAARLRDDLERLAGPAPSLTPSPIRPADEERFALLGYLAPPRLSGRHRR